MLSSPKESPEVRSTPESEAPSPFSSFLKVVDSIQGLDHLVQDISLEKIVDADKKAKQLIQHLESLQKDLTKLKTIKEGLSKSEQSATNKANKRVFDAAPDMVEKPSSNRPGSLPRNLIPFPTTPRIAKVKNDPSSLQSTPSFTASANAEPVKTDRLKTESVKPEEKPDQKTASDEGPAFCLGHLNHEASSPSHYIPSSPKKNDKEPKGGPAWRIGVQPEPHANTLHKRPQAKASSDALGQAAEPTYELIQRRPKSEGDLDRKLKTIVRDYGEVDIYSYRNKDNMRKKALIVTLLLVLGYFASSFFFPLNHAHMSAIPLRLEPGAATNHASVPEARKDITPDRPANPDDAATFPGETKPTNEQEGTDLDL